MFNMGNKAFFLKKKTYKESTNCVICDICLVLEKDK